MLNPSNIILPINRYFLPICIASHVACFFFFAIVKCKCYYPKYMWVRVRDSVMAISRNAKETSTYRNLHHISNYTFYTISWTVRIKLWHIINNYSSSFQQWSCHIMRSKVWHHTCSRVRLIALLKEMEWGDDVIQEVNVNVLKEQKQMQQGK